MDQNFKDWIQDCGGGSIEYIVKSQPLVVWLLRLAFLALGIWALWHSQHADNLLEKTIDYLVLAFAVWRGAHQGKIQAVICGRGLVFRRKPLSIEELIRSQFDTELLYTFVEYRYILGFTQDFKSVTLAPSGGGDSIIVMDIDFDFVAYKDKLAILERIQRTKEKSGSI